MSDDTSVFHKAAFEQPVPVTYLLLERATVLMAELEGAEAVLASVEAAIKQCGLCKRPTSDQIAYAVQRMAELQDEMEKAQAEGSGTTINLKSFAGEYLNWVKEMTPASMCMYLADYDYDTACKLYVEVDYKDVQELAEQKLLRDWQLVKTGFESVLFGFGGSYGDGDAVENDLEDESKRESLHQLIGL